MIADLVDLDARILADYACPAAGRVEQHTVESAYNLRELAPVVIAHNDVRAPQAVHVRGETLRARLRPVVREHHTRVLHQRRHVRRLPARRGRHVEHALARLRSKRKHGQERGRGLEHVVPCKVLGRRSDRHTALEHLQAVLGPFADRLEVDAPVDESLC